MPCYNFGHIPLSLLYLQRTLGQNAPNGVYRYYGREFRPVMQPGRPLLKWVPTNDSNSPELSAKLEIPGVSPENVEVTVAGTTVAIVVAGSEHKLLIPETHDPETVTATVALGILDVKVAASKIPAQRVVEIKTV